MTREDVIATALDHFQLLLALLAHQLHLQFALQYAGMERSSRQKHVMTAPKILMVVILHVMEALSAGTVLEEMKQLLQPVLVFAETELETFKNLVMTGQMMG